MRQSRTRCLWAGSLLVWPVGQPQRNLSYGTRSLMGSVCPVCISPLGAPVLMALTEFSFAVLEVFTALDVYA